MTSFFGGNGFAGAPPRDAAGAGGTLATPLPSDVEVAESLALIYWRIGYRFTATTIQRSANRRAPVVEIWAIGLDPRDPEWEYVEGGRS